MGDKWGIHIRESYLEIKSHQFINAAHAQSIYTNNDIHMLVASLPQKHHDADDIEEVEQAVGGQPPLSASISAPSLPGGGGATTLTFVRKNESIRPTNRAIRIKIEATNIWIGSDRITCCDMHFHCGARHSSS